MKTSTKPTKNSGQMVIEMILVMTVLIAVVGATKSFLADNEVLVKLGSGPWKVLSGMITAGAWASPDNAIVKHPAMHKNHNSIRGEER